MRSSQRAFRTNHSSTISLSSRTGVFARFCFIATHVRARHHRDMRTSKSRSFPVFVVSLTQPPARTHQTGSFSPIPDAGRATPRNDDDDGDCGLRPRARERRFGASRVPRLPRARVTMHCFVCLNLSDIWQQNATPFVIDGS